MVVLSLHNAGSLVASFLSGGGPVTETTIFFTPPDQVVETPGPPPKPDIPIVAPPGYHDAGVFWYSHNERYAAGSALDSTGRSHGLIWNSEGHATVLPPLDGSDPFSEGAFYVSDDATRALYSARSVHSGWIRALWIKGREPVLLTDLLEAGGRTGVGPPGLVVRSALRKRSLLHPIAVRRKGIPRSRTVGGRSFGLGSARHETSRTALSMRRVCAN